MKPLACFLSFLLCKIYITTPAELQHTQSNIDGAKSHSEHLMDSKSLDLRVGECGIIDSTRQVDNKHIILITFRKEGRGECE